MLTVGLTGGIAAGKSTVSAELARRGAVVIDADVLARQVVEPGTDGLAEVVAAFGPDVLQRDGSLDRATLAGLVFADKAALDRINAIIHPRVRAASAAAAAAAPPEAVVVHDVPLIVENSLAAEYDLVVVVGADEGVRIDRLMRERGMTREEAAARIRAQADDAARRAVADVWLDNSGSRAQIVEAVERLWVERLVPENERLLAAAAG
ncbi:dephospho-CoA kinase [Georgenia sp. MJ206]|uniref:dephospho-CoA kinase n=1 Tax=Georgenia wangjunii TaxID=3117730 RepID=UPI002F2688DE